MANPFVMPISAGPEKEGENDLAAEAARQLACTRASLKYF
jgi:hypothetical protein